MSASTTVTVHEEQPTTSPVQAQAERIKVLLRQIEEAGEELVMIEFADKSRGIERFKRMQQIAEDIQGIHKAMSSRVKMAAAVDYALDFACTVNDIEGQVPPHLALNARQEADLQRLLAPGRHPQTGEGDIMRSLVMTQQTKADVENAQSKAATVREFADALAALPENSPHRERVEAALVTAIDNLTR